MYKRKELSEVQCDVCERVNDDSAGAHAHLSATAYNTRCHLNSLFKIKQCGLLSQEIHEKSNNDVSIIVIGLADGS